MKVEGNTVLVTGGASGIGLALAERFLKSGNTVIICGRSESKLQRAQANFPELHTRACDLSVASEREKLVQWVSTEFPAMNVLVNNAGIQQRFNVMGAPQPWDYYRQEIAINLDAPVHLSMLFTPHLAKQPHSTIINVSSGLALAPASWAPVYSATKAALHSFSMSLRLQLNQSGIDVLEILPPAVNTDLGGVGLHTFGANVDEFADSVYEGIKRGDSEIGFGGTEQRLHLSKGEIDEAAKRMWYGFLSNNPDFQK